MSVEGGAFRCDVHLDKEGNSFKTTSLEDWNNHCQNTEGHREQGELTCSGCGELLTFSIPFQPLAADGSKGIAEMGIRCNECDPDQDKDIEVIKVNQVQGARKKK